MQRSIDYIAAPAGIESTQTHEQLVIEIGDRSMWRTLDSPIRMRLFELIRRLGECTIQELSEAAGTNPVNLYYHVRSLEGANLIAPIGHREGVARRAPVIYAVSHDELVIQFDPESKSDLERVETLQKNWHREGQECLGRGTSDSIDTVGFALRWEYLTESERGEVTEMMQRLTELLDRKREEKSIGADPDETMVFVGMQLADCSKEQLPTPRVSIVPRTTDLSTAGELRDNRQSVARTA